MKYTIYKTTNLVNGNIYIGKHKTDDPNDDYLGSGKLINRAIEKHGRENFKKEILYVFDTEEEMNTKEAELVTEEFVSSNGNYNLCPGGHGGWGYVNSVPGLNNSGHTKETHKRVSQKMKGRRRHPNSIRATAEAAKKGHKEGKYRYDGMLGKKNSQFGTMWITDGTENKKIKKDESMPEGWRRGRT